MSNEYAEQLQDAIDNGFTALVAGNLLTGYNGSAGLWAEDDELERAADAAVRLRAKVAAAVKEAI